jgi:hypothetical protein
MSTEKPGGELAEKKSSSTRSPSGARAEPSVPHGSIHRERVELPSVIEVAKGEEKVKIRWFGYRNGPKTSSRYVLVEPKRNENLYQIEMSLVVASQVGALHQNLGQDQKSAQLVFEEIAPAMARNPVTTDIGGVFTAVGGTSNNESSGDPGNNSKSDGDAADAVNEFKSLMLKGLNDGLLDAPEQHLEYIRSRLSGIR